MNADTPKRKNLGRGLSALFGEQEPDSGEPAPVASVQTSATDFGKAVLAAGPHTFPYPHPVPRACSAVTATTSASTPSVSSRSASWDLYSAASTYVVCPRR